MTSLTEETKQDTVRLPPRTAVPSRLACYALLVRPTVARRTENYAVTGRWEWRVPRRLKAAALPKVRPSLAWNAPEISHPDQHWRFLEYGTISYCYLIDYSLGEVLAFLASAAEKGRPIVQWPNPNTLNNQLWEPVVPS